MSTTAIFIELLIGGIQASVWLVILLIGISGNNWPWGAIASWGKWEALVTAIVFSFWYTLGIIVDRIARGFYILSSPAHLARKIKAVDNRAKTYDDASRIEVMVRQGVIAEYLDYIRSRVRIARVTVFNLIMIVISALIFVFTRCNEFGCMAIRSNLVWIIIATGLVLIGMAATASAMLELTYEKRVKQTQFELDKLEKKVKAR